MRVFTVLNNAKNKIQKGKGTEDYRKLFHNVKSNFISEIVFFFRETPAFFSGCFWSLFHKPLENN